MVLSCSPASHSTSINCRLCFYESLTKKVQGFYFFIFLHQIRTDVATPLPLTCIHMCFLELEKKSGHKDARNVLRNYSSFHVGCSSRSALAVSGSCFKLCSLPRTGGEQNQLHLEQSVLAELGPPRALACAHHQLCGHGIHPSVSSLSYKVTEYISHGPDLTRGQGNILSSRAAPSRRRLVTQYNLFGLFLGASHAQLLQGTLLQFAQTLAPVVGNLK